MKFNLSDILDVFLEWQRPVNFGIGRDIKKRRISVSQIEFPGFRLPETSGQIDAAITLPTRLRFQFIQHLFGQPLSTEITMCPDALELGGHIVIAHECATSDCLAITKQQ